MNPLMFSFGILVIAGLLLLGASVRAFYIGFVSRRWPKTSGKVVESHVLSTTGKSAGHTPRITFEYIVSGKNYVSKTYSTQLPFSYKGDADRVVLEYYPGRVVDVSYNPHSPGNSFLEPGLKSPTRYCFLFIGGSALSAIGCYQLWRLCA